jgi:hypothetical protein
MLGHMRGFGDASATVRARRSAEGAAMVWPGRKPTGRPHRSAVRPAALLALSLASVLPVACVIPAPAAGAQDGIDLRMDFEVRNDPHFDGLECAYPDRQFQIVTHPVRQGRYAGRFEERPGDAWSNGSIRCLVADYGSDEKEGDDRYFGLSLYLPDRLSDNTIWELHQRREIYEVAPDTAVTPHALEVVDGSLAYRLLTGPAFWNGTRWIGWSHYEPTIPLLAPVPVGTWLDIIVHIRFTHAADGILEVWARAGNGAWPQRPQISRTGVPTLQWIPGHDHRIWGRPNDPRVPKDILTSSLYTEMGVYKGGNRTETTDVVYLDGYRRGTSLEAVRAGFP